MMVRAVRMGGWVCLLQAATTLQAQASAPAGAAPPTISSAAQQERLRAILAPYRPEALTAADVRAIREAMAAAGMRRGPALEADLARAGFSAKRMEELLPSPPVAPPTGADTGTGRKVPRPQ